jgi:ATP-dependent HslUV protease subunit HslV
VLCVRKDGEVVLVADGQVTMGGTVVKPNVKKTRRIGEQAVGGFAGATADAFTLFERLETKLEEHPGQLTRAAVELAKMWRMDKYLRRLDVSTPLDQTINQSPLSSLEVFNNNYPLYH